jgi:hypothetical protein
LQAPATGPARLPPRFFQIFGRHAGNRPAGAAARLATPRTTQGAGRAPTPGPLLYLLPSASKQKEKTLTSVMILSLTGFAEWI